MSKIKPFAIFGTSNYPELKVIAILQWESTENVKD